MSTSSAALYAATFESLPFPTYVFHRQTLKFLAVNRAAVDRYGYSRREFLSMRIQDIRPASEVPALRRALQSSKNHGHRTAWRHQTREGEVFVADVVWQRLRFRGRRATLAIVFDLEERARALRTVDTAPSRYEALFSNALDAILMADDKAHFVEANPAACRLLRWPVRQLLKMTIWDITSKGRVAEGRQMFETLLKRGHLSGHYPIRLKTGANRIVEFHAVGNAQPGLHLAVLRDITDRLHAEEELRRTREQFRKLSAHTRAAREEERATLARELHDQVGQALTACKLDLAWLMEVNERSERKAVRDKLTTMMAHVDDTIGTVRRLSADLRPGVLDRLGLMAALRWQVEEFERVRGVQCRVSGATGDVRLDKGRSTGIFRIFQETLNNISQHAHATRVGVKVTVTRHQFVLDVRDNGVGIPAHAIDDSDSLGLIGMRERGALLGGSVTIARVGPRGTRVIVRVPLSSRRQTAATEHAP
jgi:PAS domain S-box-containing protein